MALASDPCSRSARFAVAAADVNRRYGPWASLIVGAAAAFLWREGVDQIRAAVVLASLAGAITLLLLFPPWGHAPRPEAGHSAWLRSAAWWATVSLVQNALWFVIPFYVLSTTWPSRNAPFTLLLIVLGVLSCFDAFLRDRVVRGGASAVAFVVPALLAAMQLFLPMLLGVPPRFTIFASGAVASIAGGCLVTPDTIMRRLPARRMLLAVVCLGALGAVGARALLPLLAPAPLRLASARFALGRDELEPVAPVEELEAGRSEQAFVFVAVEAPRGFRETVRLVVEGEGLRETRPLEITGGRAGGYRLWAPVPAREPGLIRATVRTEGGQILGVASIPVIASEPARTADPPLGGS
jgi:hypothetical protein